MLCHTCSHHHGVSVDCCAPAKRLPYPTFDMHCHLAVPEVERLVQDDPRRQAEAAEYACTIGAASCRTNAAMRDAIAMRLVSPAQRLEDMDRMGIDVQVISPSPMQYHYWADEALALQISRLINSRICEVVAGAPERFIGLGYAPVQHPVLAAQVVREAREAGLHGVEISSDPTGAGLDDPALAVFWRAAEAADATLFLHPMGTTLGPRVDRYYLANIVGQPLETTIALSQMIFGGVFDRHPRLKVCAAHGGGFLPFAPGRFDHGHGVRPEAGACARAPSEYLKQLWFDTVVFRPEALRTLVDTVGAQRVVAGTDYPFDMGEYALHELIAAVPGLSADEQAAVLGGNAMTLLGVEQDHPAVLSANRRVAL
jgi:aminocarboxymuconate-semialdehyde decarboxylase